MSDQRQARRVAKAHRRTRRLTARPGPRDPITGKRNGRRTGKRGRRLSEARQIELTDAGARKLLSEVAKLPQPQAARAGAKRAVEFSERHQAQWAA